MSKPREFWICETEGHRDFGKWFYKGPKANDIHVIEKAAYDELQLLVNAKADMDMNKNKEIKQLKERLALAVTALEIGQTYVDKYCNGIIGHLEAKHFGRVLDIIKGDN